MLQSCADTSDDIDVLNEKVEAYICSKPEIEHKSNRQVPSGLLLKAKKYTIATSRILHSPLLYQELYQPWS